MNCLRHSCTAETFLRFAAVYDRTAAVKVEPHARSAVDLVARLLNADEPERAVRALKREARPHVVRAVYFFVVHMASTLMTYDAQTHQMVRDLERQISEWWCVGTPPPISRIR